MNDQPIGRVAKETEEVIVVFSDTDSSVRFDIPKSEISTAGASVIANEDLLFDTELTEMRQCLRTDF